MTAGDRLPLDAAREDEIVDPELEITDAHHHLWDARELWENSQPRYQFDDFADDSDSGHRVTRSIFAECGWAYESRGEAQFAPVGEVRRVVEEAAKSRRGSSTELVAIVGHADLRHGEAAGPVLDALADAGQGLFVGIRQSSVWDAAAEIPVHSTRPGPGLLARAGFRAGFRELAKRDLTFDAWLYHPQLPELSALARAFPDTRIILDHLGGPLAVGPYAQRRDEVAETWQRNMSDLKLCPNVFVKLGGIAMSQLAGGSTFLTSDALVARWGLQIRWCIDQFGAERCMFESNFPVDKLRTSYVAVWNAFKRIVADASNSEKAALFQGTAAAVYGLSN